MTDGLATSQESYVAKAYREDFSNPKPRRPPKNWIIQVREDTWLPIAIAERRASDRGD